MISRETQTTPEEAYQMDNEDIEEIKFRHMVKCVNLIENLCGIGGLTKGSTENDRTNIYPFRRSGDRQTSGL